MIDIEHLENRKDFTHYDYHKYNKANGYGLSNRQLKQWILRHKDGTPKQREWKSRFWKKPATTNIWSIIAG